MTAAMSGAVDFLARVFFIKPVVDQAIQVKYLEDGKPQVYKRRWFILVAFCLGYFTWNFHAYRTTALVPEYALYFKQPNELSAPPDLGVDFLVFCDSFFLLVLYPVGGILVDTYGTNMMMFGAITQAISCWWWFFSFDAYYSVVFSKLLSNLGGACIASSLLRIANNWFGEDQRALAVAAGALFGSLGGGASLIVAPFFSTSSPVINLDIISCREEDLTFNISEAIANDDCPDLAQESFCCAAPTDIDGLNLFMAIVATLVAIYTVMVTKDAPPTPPSKAGIVRKGPTFKQALKIMFSKWNYTQLCVTDFVSSGPPLVLFSTVDRIFPASVAEYSSIAASAAFVLAIPAGAYFSIRLAKNLKFYEMTAAGYVSGFVAWFSVTILVFVGTPAADFLVLIVGVIAIICYVLWTVSVYELKMEYVFSSEFAIQGYVVAVDRTIINLSALTFLAAIPPERYTGDLMSGREFTFIVGAVFMLLGTVLVLTIRDKRDYRRMAYEQEHDETVAEILNESMVYSKPPEDAVKSLLESKKASTKKESIIRSIFFSSRQDDDEPAQQNIHHYTL